MDEGKCAKTAAKNGGIKKGKAETYLRGKQVPGMGGGWRIRDYFG